MSDHEDTVAPTFGDPEERGRWHWVPLDEDDHARVRRYLTVALVVVSIVVGCLVGLVVGAVDCYAVWRLVPTVGVLPPAVAGAEQGDVALAVLCVAMVIALPLLLRADAWADVPGRTAGLVGRRFRPDIDPQRRAEAGLDIRGRMTGSLPPRPALAGPQDDAPAAAARAPEAGA